MELLFVTVIGAGFGALVRYLLPQRGTYGSLLLPGVAAAVTAVVWVGLLWLGLKFDGTWIWVASLGAGAAAALVAALVLPRRRVAHDAERLDQLSRGRAA
jgi:cyanate permease